MTDDPIRRVAEQVFLTMKGIWFDATAAGGREPLSAQWAAAMQSANDKSVAAIYAAFRQQRAEADARAERAERAYRTVMEDASTTIDSERAECQRLRAVLRAVEFVPDGEGWQACPWCGGYRQSSLNPLSPEQHAPTCIRQAALQASPEERG